ncbi:MAG: hypothetical protein JNL69_11235, partial [Bacteroidia bacterium]|nr:hypothetical protein [Bacteroidia bacterium]
MKKYLLLLIMMAIVIGNLKSQGTSCSTAVNFSSTNSCNTGNSITATEKWFKFTGDSANVMIAVARTGGDAYITKIELYSGVCAGLTLVDTSTSYNDSTISLKVSGLTSSTQYYIKVIRGVSGTANFDVCLYNNFP